MTPLERRTSLSLAAIFALRMLGLFLVLPVFALEAQHYPGGDDPALVGLAMGMYGLTQAFLQMPLGWASDRYGRKRVMLVGLAVFALGSAVAASADSIMGLLAGRALQGAGAISAAISALLADQTRDEVRTKAMALIGASIGLMFALSLVLAPLITAWVGLSGLFGLTAAMALMGMAVVAWVVPPEQRHKHERLPITTQFLQVWRHPGLQRLNLGVFVLHTVQLSMWMVVPALLVQAGLAKAEHWQVYLPAVGVSFLLIGGLLFRLERKGHLKRLMVGAVGLLALTQAALWWGHQDGLSTWALGLWLFVFFVGFNTLEASQPSLASKLAPVHARGTALGVFNTLQSVGFFVGGTAGGWLVKHVGVNGLFAFTLVLTLLWAWRIRGMQVPVTHPPKTAE